MMCDFHPPLDAFAACLRHRHATEYIPIIRWMQLFRSARLIIVICLSSVSWSQSSTPVYRNLDPSVAYAGSQSCAASGCHEELSRKYVLTPMGHSMAPANSPAELARVPQPVTVFSAKTKRYYTVFSRDNDLYQSVYQLSNKGKKTYEAEHKLDYVVGGGLTGYSYIFRIGQWMFQAPLSFYSERGTWELSPGYQLDDIGFTRPISTACLSCHNGQPIPVPKRDGMYQEPYFRYGEMGMSCEACHGPGQLHNQTWGSKKGQIHDVKAVDATIVNPARLAPSLADDLCMECHQSGDAIILMPGKGFLDFRPGQPLYQTMAIFRRPLREEHRAEANRLETEAPVRGSLEAPLWWKNSSLQLSRCYQESHGHLTCITCHAIHNPPTPENKVAYYRDRCLSCHTDMSCKASSTERQQQSDNCIACHMEKRAVAGIAHSNDTKHRIVRHAGQPLPEVAFEKPRPDLPDLLWTNRPPDSSITLPLATRLQAYWSVSKKDPSLEKYCLPLLEELAAQDPDNPVVLHGLGALALSGDKAFSARDLYSKALKGGNQELTTYTYLATALNHIDHAQEAETVLERAIATYPYTASLRIALARQYLHDNKGWRARFVLNEYLKLFPEDTAVRDVLNEIQAAGQ